MNLRQICSAAALLLAVSLGSAAQAQSVSRSIVTYDDKLMKIAEKAPGFAGMFLDEKGIFTIRMTNANWLNASAKPAEELAKVVATINSVMGKDFIEHAQISRPDAKTKDIAMARADFSFTQLFGWKKNVDELLSIPGVVTTDINETRNRITIGFELFAKASVEAAVTKLGVPMEAIVLYVTKPDEPQATLRSKIRPVPAGVQIEADTAVFDSLRCTLGFNVIRFGRRGFVTNSHCTENRGVSNDTDFHQPDDPVFSEANKIGDEDADPPFFTGFNCPQFSRCRFSDAAYVDYGASTQAEFGRIARPENSFGSLTIDTVNSRFRIVSETPDLVEGMILNKVGRTTGWTFGVVTQVCAPRTTSGTNFRFLCQGIVRGLNPNARVSASGDSGSPVFLLLGNPNEVSLAGILWGGVEADNTFVFSKIALVKQELGPMITFNTPAPPAPPPPPRPRNECTAACDEERNACLAEGQLLPSQCVRAWNACRSRCAAQ